MREKWVIFLLILCVRLSAVTGWNDHMDVKYYTNNWLAHVPLGEMVAKEVARSHDMDFDGPEIGLDGFYRMIKRDLSPTLFSHQEDITNRLTSHDLVSYATQEAVKARSLRSVIPPNKNSAQPRRSIPNRTKTESPTVQSNYELAFNDARWPDMWYFQDVRTNPLQPVVDMNIVPVYFDLRITGEGVNITVPDDGLDWAHPEIVPKFRPELSWNYITNTNNIMPDKDVFGSFRTHGTRCAGEIIMQPDNELCGVGTAYGANIGGIKFLDETSTDAREAKVLKHALEYVDIYSNSWGPADTGTFMEHLTGRTIKKALSKGIHEGRNGKGAIYVFAAGNGKSEGDNCACDGYVNSIYTIVIASCDDSGHVTHYSERCAAIMATAYSGSGQAKNVLTTDLNGGCTDQHTGTSAAAPLVSGIIALALSANPSLEWRDVQHLFAWTCQVAPLSDNYGWNRNMAGFFYSVDFGFGLVNALYLVKQAQTWENVPEMSSCGVRLPQVKDFPVSRNKAARIIATVNGCEGLSGEVNYMESLQIVLTMTYPKRGDIQIAMRSPLGTEVHVLESRQKDFSDRGLRKWTFSVLAFWGESPKGNFVIDIYDTTGPPTNQGRIVEMTLSIHGTKDAPKIYQNGARSYDNFILPRSGDKPRFFHLSSTDQTNLENSKNKPESFTPDANTVNIQNENKVQEEVKLNEENKPKQESSGGIADFVKNTALNWLWNIEHQGDNQEGGIMPGMFPKFSSLFDNGLYVGPQF